jgi:hypothetical protein
MKKKTERNTDGTGPERIWRLEEVDTMWFNHKNQTEDNTVEKTIEFLKNAKIKAKEEGFEEIVVKPSYYEGEDAFDQYFIKVYGYRWETDKEYKNRLEGLLFGMKVAKNNWENRRTYYDGDGYALRCSLLEITVKNIDKYE